MLYIYYPPLTWAYLQAVMMWTETSPLELHPLAVTEWFDAHFLAGWTVSGWPTNAA